MENLIPPLGYRRRYTAKPKGTKLTWQYWLGNALAIILLGKLVSPMLDSIGCGIRAWWSRADWKHWEGTRYSYSHSNKKGQAIFIESEWVIRRRLFGGLVISFTQIDTGATYRGVPQKDGPHIVILFRGRNLSELNVWRLMDPLATNMDEVFGICMSLDYDKEIVSTGVLISSTKLDLDQAEQRIKDNVKRIGNRPVLGIAHRA